MTIKAPKVLFILKQRMPGPYGSWNYSSNGQPLASGLFISAQEMTKALDEMQIENKLVHVIDNNCIDREVTKYKPTHVMIEAFWVVPEKFDVLKRLHPKVKWVVRNHSKPAFLANEGGMVGWALDYIRKGVTVASNSLEATRDFKVMAEALHLDPRLSVYLPNYYQSSPPKRCKELVKWAKLLRSLGFDEGAELPEDGELHIGCFGAVRPMKNHLTQAIAAIELATALGLRLNFWINGDRIEGKGDAHIKSIRELFKRFPAFELHELSWQKHDDFVELVKKMHIVTQVSNSETFNIVAADAVANGVPVVGSAEIPWLDHEYTADPGSAFDIAKTMMHVWENSERKLLQADQLLALRRYTEHTKEVWARYLHGAKPC